MRRPARSAASCRAKPWRGSRPSSAGSASHRSRCCMPHKFLKASASFQYRLARDTAWLRISGRAGRGTDAMISICAPALLPAEGIVSCEVDPSDVVVFLLFARIDIPPQAKLAWVVYPDGAASHAVTLYRPKNASRNDVPSVFVIVIAGAVAVVAFDAATVAACPPIGEDACPARTIAAIAFALVHVPDV